MKEMGSQWIGYHKMFIFTLLCLLASHGFLRVIKNTVIGYKLYPF